MQIQGTGDARKGAEKEKGAILGSQLVPTIIWKGTNGNTCVSICSPVSKHKGGGGGGGG